jgi:predicted Zn-dependent protease
MTSQLPRYLGRMRRWSLIALLFAACTAPAPLCQRYFEPYADLVSGRLRTTQNAVLLDGMAAYSAGEHGKAVELLTAHLNVNPKDVQARLYLTNALLATGEPYDAELQIDLMERELAHEYSDQMEWYRTLCMVCSDQTDRATQLASAIANESRHAYKKEAAKLLEDLGAK